VVVEVEVTKIQLDLVEEVREDLDQQQDFQFLLRLIQ
jgi:hypothetical protein